MTSSSDTDQHPDIPELSEFVEGLVAPRRTSELTRHLADCDVCADIHRSLCEIRSLLGDVPNPPAMPADVAERIDAALAAEAFLDATGSASVWASGAAALPEDLGPDGPQVPAQATARARNRSATQHPHVSRETLPPREGTHGHVPAGTGTGRARARRSRRATALGIACGVATLDIGAFLLWPSASPDTSSPLGSAATSHSHASQEPSNFSGSPLDARVDVLLSTKDSSTSPRDTGAQATSTDADTFSEQPLMQPEPTVPTCVRQAAGPDETVLAAEQGTYRGVPAYLLILAVPANATTVRVYVVDAGCVGTSPPIKGKLLLTESRPRH